MKITSNEKRNFLCVAGNCLLKKSVDGNCSPVFYRDFIDFTL